MYRLTEPDLKGIKCDYLLLGRGSAWELRKKWYGAHYSWEEKLLCSAAK